MRVQAAVQHAAVGHQALWQIFAFIADRCATFIQQRAHRVRICTVAHRQQHAHATPARSSADEKRSDDIRPGQAFIERRRCVQVQIHRHPPPIVYARVRSEEQRTSGVKRQRPAQSFFPDCLDPQDDEGKKNDDLVHMRAAVGLSITSVFPPAAERPR